MTEEDAKAIVFYINNVPKARGKALDRIAYNYDIQRMFFECDRHLRKRVLWVSKLQPFPKQNLFAYLFGFGFSRDVK